MRYRILRALLSTFLMLGFSGCAFMAFNDGIITTREEYIPKSVGILPDGSLAVRVETYYVTAPPFRFTGERRLGGVYTKFFLRPVPSILTDIDYYKNIGVAEPIKYNYIGGNTFTGINSWYLKPDGFRKDEIAVSKAIEDSLIREYDLGEEIFLEANGERASVIFPAKIGFYHRAHRSSTKKFLYKMGLPLKLPVLIPYSLFYRWQHPSLYKTRWPASFPRGNPDEILYAESRFSERHPEE